MESELELHQMPPPESGQATELVAGLKWLRMPLPFSLEHINLWLLKDGDSWVAVDSGLGTGTTEQLWRRVFTDVLGDQPIHRLLVTHMHPDHVGMAGWLCEHFGLMLEMTRTEYLQCRNLVNDTFQQPPKEALSFYRSAGWDEGAVKRYTERFGGFGRVVRTLPNAFHRLQDNDELTIGGNRWTVIIGRGHSPEHACFFSPDLNAVISGDQILPGISSNVSVWPTEPNANPLADWLASCRHLQRVLPEDVLVLPSHGQPFRGAHRRLQGLIVGHEAGLERVTEACREPKRAVDLLGVLFRRTLQGEHWIMATGECIATLNYLESQGAVQREPDADGVDYYRRT